MKWFIKFILKKFGYRVVKIHFYENWVNINDVKSLDFHHIFKNITDREKILCCFDVGANIGQTAKKFLSYFPNSTIYCFEPILQTYQQLNKNVQEFSRIKAYNLGMGSDKDNIEIFHRDNSELNSLVGRLNENAKLSGATSEFIKVDTIDNFVKEEDISKIDILKSDTEGFDMEVLKGAKYCLENQLIDLLYIEVGFNKSDFQHSYVIQIIDVLENYGYGFSGLFEMSYTEQNIILYANALFRKRDKC